ncbi:MAG TPA: DNA primase, partial [Rhodospirillales bacterium]|nr:DNA primase [Rhodospirillales bacterium]
MSLSQGFLDEIKARVGTAEVIGKRVRLIRRGRQFLGLCPFHGEKTPSFHVWDDHYHCFGCGAHGSVIDFVMQADKVGFREAVERVAAMAGLSMPQTSPEEQASERRRGALVDVMAAATRWYARTLRMPEGKAALDYLRRRGLSDAAIERWRLGFAPDSGQAVKAALGREGIDEAALLEAGLLVQPEDGGRSPYDRFRGRVMFPIADRRGRVLGFGGRLLGPGEPKYLNSPETALFHKGRQLYGIDRAIEAARTAGSIVVVEGYMDVIGMAEAGWPQVVAPLGTALTEDQLRLLWAIVPEPILLFDPDAAGERAALRAAERALPLLKPGLGLRIALLRVDTRDDPDRVAARWPAQVLHRTLQEAAPLSDFLFRIENKGRLHVPPEERAAVEERLRRRAAAIADANVRTHFQRAFRERAWQAVRSRPVRNQQGRTLPGKGAPGYGRGSAGNAAGGASPMALEAAAGWAAPPNSRTRAELMLCALAVRRPEIVGQHEEELGRLAFADDELDQLRQQLLMLHATHPDIGSDVVQAELRRRGLDAALDRVLDHPLPKETAESTAAGAAEDATWSAHMAVLRRLALKQELAGD